MRIDFHTHGKLAKQLPFSTVYTDWLFAQAKSAGLDAICLTEHFNTLQFDELYRYIASVSRRAGDCLELENGLRIFPGMETDVAECGHILSVGPLEAILELNRRLAPYKAKGSFLPIAQLMDLFDLNGKDIALDRARTERLTYALAEKLELPVISGSDTHQAVQYGCISTVLEQDCTTFDEIFSQVRAGAYRIEVAQQAAFQVQTASLLKRALKEIHALGGDYVSILTAKTVV